MSGPQFFQTTMGHQHYDSTMPRIATALETIAGHLEKTNQSGEPQTKSQMTGEQRRLLLQDIIEEGFVEDEERDIWSRHEIIEELKRILLKEL